jgi:hypothetical protein
VSRAAEIRGNAAFLLPLGVTVPLRQHPPSMTNFSIVVFTIL